MRAAAIGRRAALRSMCLHCAGLSAWLAADPVSAQPAGPAPPVPAADASPPARFTRPAIDTDEGGLWALMDREETRLRRSPFLVRDTALQDYLRGIVCRLAGDHCPDVRVHVVRTPVFNASMAPNGMMQVWTGLLLRVENEAQLAAVLGHEIGHYLERHSVEQLRDFKSRAAFAQFLGLFGAVGSLGQLGMLAGAFAFSREHETRADSLGMRLMQRAGYDGQQAAQVWDNLLQELKVSGGEDVGRRSPMMATHPPVESRRDTLLRLAGDRPGEAGEQAYRDATLAHRLGWLQDEIRRGQFDESLPLLDRLVRKAPRDPVLLFARGEVYRLRAGAPDAARALEDLSGAVAQEGVPTIAFRSLGLVHRQRSDAPAALRAFEAYLARTPEAPDAALIRHYMTEMTP
jgi:predicted Zn-dependent protease